ncbi:MAG: TolC family protein [Gemmatimonadota bacterium]|nr:TolC family protein [Gemmatimonadota bacterium]MDE2871524.1 TolC family protein [Gemmatimonadota bacterium]
MRQSRARPSPVPVVCGVLLAPSAAIGQEAVRRVSLAEALEAFAANSLALKIARSEAAGLMAGARQSRAYFNPQFSFERDDLGHNEEKAREETFQLLQQVEWPGRTNARARAATHTIRAGSARLRADSVELAFEVREAYVRAWFAEEAESIVRRTAAVIQSVAEDAEARLEAGDISAFEARRLRLARVEAEQELEEAVLRTRAARRNLAVLVEPGTEMREIGPSEGLDGVPPMIGREAALAALDGRPDVEAAASELDAARAGLDVARTYWVPVPSLGLGYRHHDDGFGGASIGLDVPLPLFDRGSGTREEAAAHSSAAAYRLELRREMARYDVLAASDRYSSNRARLDAAAQGLRTDGEALLASATAAYAEQEMTLLELLDAAGAFQVAQLSALSLTTEAWVSYYDLLRATGSAPEDER